MDAFDFECLGREQTSEKTCKPVIHFKSNLLSEMVAEDYLVSFLRGNSVLDFCDLINKNKQRTILSS